MKRNCIFTFVFLFAGIFSVSAQDLIVLRNGNMIDARVLEISQTEIRYKRFDHLEGPTIVIPIDNVLSIRYENGRQESFADPTSVSVPQTSISSQGYTQPVIMYDTAINPDRFIFGVSAFGGGSVGIDTMGGGGGLRFEFGKGNFNSEINIGSGFPVFLNFLATFNYFWHSRIGGFYLGGGVGYYMCEWYRYTGHFFQLGLNIGYKFVTRSGVFYNIGAFTGGAIGSDFNFVFRPDISFGWTMR